MTHKRYGEIHRHYVARPYRGVPSAHVQRDHAAHLTYVILSRTVKTRLSAYEDVAGTYVGADPASEEGLT